MADKALKKIMVDGVGLVEVTDEAETVISKLQKDLLSSTALVSTRDGEIVAKDSAHAEAITAKDKEIADLKAKLADTTNLDARVAERAKLVQDAKLIAGDDLVVDGKTDLEVQKAAVSKKLGDDAVKDKADTFFVGAFDVLAIEAAKTGGKDTSRDGLRDALRPEDTRQPQQDGKKAPSYEDRMSNRWKQKENA